MTNIEVFNETMHIINTNEKLKSATKKAIENTVVYGEGFQSLKKPKYESKVGFEENLTLLAAESLSKTKRVAVLNFANPIEPGGGVLRGANAQEEYLCRAGNLYPCLISDNAKPYYEFHKKQFKENKAPYYLSTDRLIYSKDVTVIRKDIGFLSGIARCKISQEYSDDWYQIDVITCAAPCFYYEVPIDEMSLKELFKKRIRNIFEAAIENDAKALVLGAFGCGAFYNPPKVVAAAFSEALLEGRYSNAFENVVFAVKRTGHFCENIEAFQSAFYVFPPMGEYTFISVTDKRRFFE